MKAVAISPVTPVATMFVIYDHPLDHPQHFVVRQWFIVKEDDLPRAALAYRLCTTLEEARRCIPEGLVRIEQSQYDEPQIAEVWL